MAQILVRNLDPATVERLKLHAKDRGRSLQSEVADVLSEHARRLTMSEARQMSLDYHARFAGRTFSDSADLIREDRDR